MKKIGILIVAYGLGSEKAESSFADFCLLAKRKFQPFSVRHAFTSDLSRDRLAKQGKKSDSVIKALEKMVFEKYTHIYIQSLHLISGIEYKTLVRAARQMMNNYPVFIRVAKPLLLEENLYPDMAKSMAKNFASLCPVHNSMYAAGNNNIHYDDLEDSHECICRKSNADNIALVYMAHGTRKSKNDNIPYNFAMLKDNAYISNASIHELSANALYVRFAKALQEYDERIFLACMKGSLSYFELKKALNEQKIKKISLFPFLSLLGSHTLDDMAGDDNQSWKSQLINDGFECDAHCISLLQTHDFVNFWLQSLENLINEHEKADKSALM